MKWLGLTLPWLLASVALADVRTDIEKQYSRATEAMKLKYLDGIQSIRSREFELFDKEGTRLDLPVERMRTQQFLAPALTVDEKAKIVDFDQQSSKRVKCVVTYETKVTTLDRLTNRELTQVLLSRNEDVWVLTEKGWRVAKSQVVSQEFKR